MDICKNCSKKFSFWQVYKTYWGGKLELECPNCEFSHVCTMKSRVLSTFSVILIPGIIQIAIQSGEKSKIFSIWTLLMLYIAISFIMSFLTNPLLKFKLTKK